MKLKLKLIHPEVLCKVLYILVLVLPVCALIGNFRISQTIGLFALSGFAFTVAKAIKRSM